MWILIIVIAVILLIYLKDYKNDSGFKGWAGGNYVSLNKSSSDRLSGMMGNSFVVLNKNSDRWIGGNFVFLEEKDNGELSGMIGSSFTTLKEKSPGHWMGWTGGKYISIQIG